jgi:hypothetical protein
MKRKRMELGRKKADYRIKIYAMKSGKSKTISVHNEKLGLTDLYKKIVQALRRE